MKNIRIEEYDGLTPLNAVESRSINGGIVIAVVVGAAFLFAALGYADGRSDKHH